MPTELTPIVHVKEGRTWADSRDVASFFQKQHKDVLKAVRNLHCSAEFLERNFAPFKINDLTGESTSHYEMTKSGFAFLIRESRETGRMLFQVDALNDWMKAEGKTLIRAHLDRLAGQTVINFPKKV